MKYHSVYVTDSLFTFEYIYVCSAFIHITWSFLNFLVYNKLAISEVLYMHVLNFIPFEKCGHAVFTFWHVCFCLRSEALGSVKMFLICSYLWKSHPALDLCYSRCGLQAVGLLIWLLLWKQLKILIQTRNESRFRSPAKLPPRWRAIWS